MNNVLRQGLFMSFCLATATPAFANIICDATKTDNTGAFSTLALVQTGGGYEYRDAGVYIAANEITSIHPGVGPLIMAGIDATDSKQAAAQVRSPQSIDLVFSSTDTAGTMYELICHLN